MTDARSRQRRPVRGGMGAGWKSAILAASLSAVLLGWSILSRTETSAADRPGAAAAQAIAAQAPASFQVASAGGRVILVPAMPQRPAFTRPITRSRAS